MERHREDGRKLNTRLLDNVRVLRPKDSGRRSSEDFDLSTVERVVELQRWKSGFWRR
jgi:hypothetical protein